ncbi:MAG: hypothetical protein JWN76_300 [Chitinophagaceae bacterium]|nr:hypothetical protein [Chitinophagaceae bacterium]
MFEQNRQSPGRGLLNVNDTKNLLAKLNQKSFRNTHIKSVSATLTIIMVVTGK